MASLSYRLARTVLDGVAARRRLQPAFEALFTLSLAGLGYGTGGRVDSSGEHVAIDYMASCGVERPLVFDVGANVGAWTTMALRRFHTSPLIYAFEPSAAGFARLAAGLASQPNVICHQFGFASCPGTQRLYSNAPASGLASLHSRRLAHFSIALDLVEEVDIRTLDDFCQAEAIGKIDFLKLDVEGSEMGVLQGSQRMLTNDAIKVIQWEMGGCNIDSRTFFQDFWYALSPRYRLYRILRDGLAEVPRYRENLEVFVTTNYLAIHKTMPEVASRLLSPKRTGLL